MFNYFSEFSDAAFRVIADNYVTDDSGTGIVHCAPAFGEDDYRVCIANQIIIKVCHKYSLLIYFSFKYYFFSLICWMYRLSHFAYFSFGAHALGNNLG